MYFLNPAILIALSAISIPVIIHLFNLQKIRKIEFSSLMFLKELQKSKIKRIKLKQLLLLLLRIMVIAFLVLSFAKPVYKGYTGTAAADVKKTVMIILDNSFSMSAADEHGTYLQQAKDAVKNILATHSESDEFYFIPESGILLKDRKIIYNSKRELLDSLENIDYSFKPSIVSEQLNIAGDVFSSSLNQVNELFIVSDFQRSNFNSGVIPAGIGNSLKEKNVNLFLINSGKRNVNNISLDSVSVVSKLLEKDRDVKLKVMVNNHTDYNVTNKIINLYSGNLLIGEKAVDLNSLEKKEIEFTLNLNKTGYINGYFELLRTDSFEDEIPEDNKYNFTLYIPEKIRIGIVEDSPEDSKYIRLAFSTAQNFLSNSPQSENFFELTVSGINPSLSNFDLVFITGRRTINENEAEVLKDYITNGGGVFILPSEDIDLNSYNRFLSGINSSRIGSLNDNQSVNQNLKFDKIDFEHPVLSEVFQNKNLSLTDEQFRIESPSVYKYYDILPGENSGSIINLSNGKSFLASSRFNNGRILISSISPGTAMSDFQSKSIFLPVIIRSAYYLGNNYELNNANYIGKNNLIMLNNTDSVSLINNPSGDETEFNFTAGSVRNSYIVIPYDRFFSTPGIYDLRNNEGKSFSFSLNHDPQESKPEKMNKAELVDFFEELEFSNVFFIDAGERVNVNITEARTGLDLWKYFLFAALVFLALELLLSKRMEKE